MITEKVPATVEELTHVLEIIDSQLEANDCSMKIQLQIDLAVEELFVNIAHYAYAQDEENADAEIILDIQQNPCTMVLTFKDHGIPYNPLKKEDPDVTLSAEERKIGGLGIYLVKKTMDRVDYRYEDGHNILTITKVLEE